MTAPVMRGVIASQFTNAQSTKMENENYEKHIHNKN